MITESKILRWALILGIVILVNLFFNYAISLVYESPDFETFCPQTQVVTIPNSQNECLAQGGQWTDNANFAKPVPASISERVDLRVTEGYCDLQFTCRQDYQEASDDYGRNIFIILVVLGALAVLAGSLLKRNEVISSGLALAGVLSFIIASMRYWGSANDLIRVIILAIAIGILFSIAWKKFSGSNIVE